MADSEFSLPWQLMRCRRPATTILRSWAGQDGVLQLRATSAAVRHGSPLTYDVVLTTPRGTFPIGRDKSSCGVDTGR